VLVEWGVAPAYCSGAGLVVHQEFAAAVAGVAEVALSFVLQPARRNYRRISLPTREAIDKKCIFQGALCDLRRFSNGGNVT